MYWKFFGVSLGCMVLTCVGCKRVTLPSSSAVASLDACALITRAEIEATQGSSVKDIKNSTTTGGGFRVSQCFYGTAEFNKSVSLAVTQRDPAKPSNRSARDHWEEMFNPNEEKERGEAENHEREEEAVTPPRKIDGVGEDARWTGMRFGGALYVLKKDAFMRISVGGGNDEESRINRSKTLALKALGRL
jgi:hypothetical protein